MPAQNPRKTCVKLPGDFADAQVWNCLLPDDFVIVLVVVLRHGLVSVAGDLLTVLSGFLVQVQRQRPHFMEAWHFLFLPSLVTTRHFRRLLEGSR